jgi:hypothetical protein
MMSSERLTTERLPWYLNGTLDAAERQAVERDLAESAEARRELAELQDAARIYGHRLPVDIIVGYAFDGAHPDVSTDLLERFLAVSPVGREELEWVRESRAALEADTAPGAAADVIAFRRPAAPPAAPGVWRRLALAASLLGVVSLGVAVWQLQEARSTHSRLAEAQLQLRQALAAEASAQSDEALRQQLQSLEGENSQLAAGKSDLVEQIEARDGEIERLSEQVAELRAPLVNIPVVDVWPGDMVLRGEPRGERVVVVPRQTRTVALILNSSVAADRGVSGLRILGTNGERVWVSSDKPQRDELGTFTVALPVQELAPGRYTLQLIDQGVGTTQVVETYEIEIR